MLKWLKTSNRYKHLLGGLLIGLGANTIFCAAYVGIIVASALEFKDTQHKCKWDWIDWICTVCGVSIGYLIRYYILDKYIMNS